MPPTPTPGAPSPARPRPLLSLEPPRSQGQVQSPSLSREAAAAGMNQGGGKSPTPAPPNKAGTERGGEGGAQGAAALVPALASSALHAASPPLPSSTSSSPHHGSNSWLAMERDVAPTPGGSALLLCLPDPLVSPAPGQGGPKAEGRRGGGFPSLSWAQTSHPQSCSSPLQSLASPFTSAHTNKRPEKRLLLATGKDGQGTHFPSEERVNHEDQARAG